MFICFKNFEKNEVFEKIIIIYFQKIILTLILKIFTDFKRNFEEKIVEKI